MVGWHFCGPVWGKIYGRRAAPLWPRSLAAPSGRALVAVPRRAAPSAWPRLWAAPTPTTTPTFWPTPDRRRRRARVCSLRVELRARRKTGGCHWDFLLNDTTALFRCRRVADVSGGLGLGGVRWPPFGGASRPTVLGSPPSFPARWFAVCGRVASSPSSSGATTTTTPRRLHDIASLSLSPFFVCVV
jgi:hypothetical protein